MSIGYWSTDCQWYRVHQQPEVLCFIKPPPLHLDIAFSHKSRLDIWWRVKSIAHNTPNIVFQGDWGLTEAEEEVEERRRVSFCKAASSSCCSQLRIVQQTYQVCVLNCVVT